MLRSRILVGVSIAIVTSSLSVRAEPGMAALEQRVQQVPPDLLKRSAKLRLPRRGLARSLERQLREFQLNPSDSAAKTVTVIVEATAGKVFSNWRPPELAPFGAQVEDSSRSFARVRLPVTSLPELAAHPDVGLVRPPIPKVALGGAGFGPIVSESVALCNADTLQASSITGDGVRVAVIDLGFIGLAAAIAAGELPSDTVSVDFSGTGLETDTPHGVGVAEHVVDMAPGVSLYCLKVGDSVGFQNAADYLA
ncbi:MAG: hypothetical protein AAF517_15530, partial [Planctomycetota bacterium]